MKITKENQEFLDKLFENILKKVDTDMIDLHNDNTCSDHVEIEKLADDD